MEVAWLVLILIPFCNCQGIILKDPGDDLFKCTSKIFPKFFSGKSVTVFDINSKDQIIQMLLRLNNLTIISRFGEMDKLDWTSRINNLNYVITAEKPEDFNNFSYLIQDPYWRPDVNFLIYLKNSNGINIRQVFNILLSHRVYKVVVVNGTENIHLYGYNPLEAGLCASTYKDVIQYGKCDNISTNVLFRKPSKKSLKGCMLNVAASHWPPYIITPTRKITNNDQTYSLGIEQQILYLLANTNGFHLNFTYSNDGEEFCTVSTNMTAVGNMYILQQNKADIVVGGMLFTTSRSQAFSYIYTHFAYMDEISVIVRSADFVPQWKLLYKEFNFTVWLLLLVTFGVYFVLTTLLLPKIDKSLLFLSLLDNLFLHAGMAMKSVSFIKSVIITWIWFSWLVNTFYQTSLVSLITHPSKEYQVSTIEDLDTYQFEPCISLVMRKIFEMNEYDLTPGCIKLLESIETTSEKKNTYTISMSSLYFYNKYQYYNKWGESKMYVFPKPIYKLIYAIYFYKGFPLRKELNAQVLRLMECGMIHKIVGDLYYTQQTKYNSFQKDSFHAHLVIPWTLFISGTVASIICFILEIISKRLLRRRPYIE